MAATVDRHEVGEIDLGIDLRGCQRAVAEELLYRAQIHARLEQVSGKGVT